MGLIQSLGALLRRRPLALVVRALGMGQPTKRVPRRKDLITPWRWASSERSSFSV